MKISGRDVRSSMATIFRPSRCLSIACPWIAWKDYIVNNVTAGMALSEVLFVLQKGEKQTEMLYNYLYAVLRLEGNMLC